MSWLYLPEQAADYLPPHTCSNGEPSAMSNGTPTVSQSSSSASKTDTCTMPRSGTTCRHSTGNPGLDAWISSLLGSRANRSAQQANETGTKTSAICGRLPFASLEKYDQLGYCLKTSLDYSAQWTMPQLSLIPILGLYSETWPKAGMMLDGACYQQPKWERRIKGIGSLLWPTPRVTECKMGARIPTKALLQRERSHGWDLVEAVYDAANTHHIRWPTQQKALQAVEVGDKLNPPWIEWLMGWPIGWTDLEPLATDKFQQWLAQFGDF